MKLRVHDLELVTALSEAGLENGDEAPGLLIAPRIGIEGWDEVEEELVEIFTLTQQAARSEEKVVVVMPTASLIGRAPVCDSAIAAGLMSGVRALSVEHRGQSHVAAVVAYGADSPLSEVAQTVAWVMAAPHLNGQVVLVGDEQMGALLP